MQCQAREGHEREETLAAAGTAGNVTRSTPNDKGALDIFAYRHGMPPHSAALLPQYESSGELAEITLVVTKRILRPAGPAGWHNTLGAREYAETVVGYRY
jgi:hypothetical protein